MLDDKMSPNGGKALKYGRAGSERYDEIGFRTLAASTTQGPGRLRTIASSRYEREVRRRCLLPPFLQVLDNQQRRLRHRPLTTPAAALSHYESDDAFFDLILANGEMWSYPKSAPPTFLQRDMTANDAIALGHHPDSRRIPGAAWLPLSRLISMGRFVRLQDWQGDLVAHEAGAYHVLVSHRWLCRAHPDPEGRQAQAVAWQLVGAIAEAIRIASVRGLHNPRMAHALSGMIMGIHGSSLAESLLVNLVRRELDDTRLEAAVAEVAGLPHDVVDAGRSDPDLRRLAGFIAGHPQMRQLISRVRLWYDYSCLPQTPRTAEDERFFQLGLLALGAIQISGHTVVLLDDPEDYLSRAWCTLEAITAHRYLESPHILVGSQAAGHDASVEREFNELLRDRSAIVWRGLLDTVVFEVQTFDLCARRLGVSVTNPADLEIIRRALHAIQAPLDIQTDDSEIVTGTMPLPVIGGHLVCARLTGYTRTQSNVETPLTLDWSAAIQLTNWRGPVAPSFARFDRSQPQSRTGHVAVLGSCEGEAVLFAAWARDHRQALEGLLDIEVESMSWTAVDVAPVAHLVDGRLTTHPIESDVWVLVTTYNRLLYGQITNFLQASLAHAGKSYATLAIDLETSNVTWTHADPNLHDCITYPLGEEVLPTHVGGLFRPFIPTDLFPALEEPPPLPNPIHNARQLSDHGRFQESSALTAAMLEEIGDRDDPSTSQVRAQICSIYAVNAYP